MDHQPTLAEVRAGIVPFLLPLTRRFRGVEHREGLLLQGPSGWGEWAPFAEYDDVTAGRWLAAAIEAAFGSWPAPLRTSVPVNAIIPAVPAADAARLTAVAVRDTGVTTVKVKVAERGESLEDDVARIAAVRDAIGPQGRVRIDANAAWTVAQARAALAELAGFDLEYVEQPCATLEELAELRRHIDIPVAADESIRLADDPVRAARAGACDLVILKATPLGGVGAALRVAESIRLPVVVSGAMDTAIGLDAGVALAAVLGELPFACGLGTGALLERDIVDTPLRPVAGSLDVVRHHPDPAALAVARASLPDERLSWWTTRLERAWTAVTGSPGARWVRR